jgi:membrane protein
VSRADRTDRPDPAPPAARREAAAGVEGPTDLPRRSWWSVLKRTVREVRDDNLTDWAAALTYYAVLALFPALVALVALVGLFGSYPQTTDALLDIVDDIGPESAVETFRGPIEEVVRQKGGAGALLGVGLLGALWSASGYVGAFMRASNVVYETEEGRRFWKLRPLQIGITLVMVIVAALVGASVALTGPLARSVGDVIGLGDTAVTLWNIGKWPVIALIVTTMFAFLYWVGPNVRQPSFRWITPGGVLALVTWLVASAGFALYVAFFGSYNKTYGSLGGVVIFLVWLWLTNLALLVGLEFNAELERGRELALGQPAEDELQLPPREAPRDDDEDRRDRADQAREIRLDVEDRQSTSAGAPNRGSSDERSSAFGMPPGNRSRA